MLLFLGLPLFGQPHKLLYSVIDNGSNKSEMTGYTLKDAVGQSVTGKSKGGGYFEYVGFSHPIKPFVGIEEAWSKKNIPTIFSFSPAFPNPAGSFVTLKYGIPRESYVSIKVYTLAGRVVRKLVDGIQKPRFYRIYWDGKNDDGTRVASGIYFYRIEADEFRATRKFTILR